MNFRDDIQGLRALAVISVIIFHIQHEWLPGGFIGVDIFFVISGFLISKSIIDGKDKDQFNFFRFFIGRFKRIVPAYYFMLLFCIGAAILYFPSSFFAPFYGELRNTIFFLSNRAFGMWINYFGAQNHQNLLLHTWSLSIEMQFYIILPLIVMIIPKRWRVASFICIFIILLAYTEYNLRVLGENSKMYFSLPARSLEFIIGIAVNFLPSDKKLKGVFKQVLSIIALTTVILSFFLINENSIFPGLTALPACVGTAIIIWLSDSRINLFFSNKILVFIGTISYSLYLWHWPVLAFYRFQIDSYDISTMHLIYLIPTFIILSLISYYLIEEPFRKMKNNKLYLFGGFLVVIVCFLTFASKKINSVAVPIPNEYITSLSDMRNHHKFDKEFLIGDIAKESDNILLIGDSHCHSLRGFFDIIGKQYQLNFSTLSMNSMVPVYGCENCPFTNKIDKEVYDNLIAVADKLIKKADIIILVKQWHRDYDISGQIEYFKKTLTDKQKLVIVQDYPILNEDPVRKYKSFLMPKNFKKENLKQPKIDSSTLKFVKENHNFYFLNINDNKFFSNAPYFQDTLMYYDKGHLNLYGSSKLANFQGNKVAEFLLDVKSKQK